MSASHLRLVAVNGAQIAPAPRRRVRDAARREEREIMLAIIREHLGHITHSLNRLKTLTNELEGSLGIPLPDDFVWPRPDALSGSPDVSV
jgi:hypothetical protein